ISLSSASHFGLRPYSKTVKPVVLPPGRAKLATKPAPTGSMTPTNTIGTLRVSRCNAATTGEVTATTTSGASATNSAAYWRQRSAPPAPQTVAMRGVAAAEPPKSREPLREGCHASLSFAVVRSIRQQHADAPHPLGLLRARRERPRRSAAEKRDERAP